MAIQAKVGDVVHVRGTAKSVGLHTVCVEFDRNPMDGKDSAIIALGDIVHVEPQPLKVGDRVVSNNGFLGTINGIDAYHAWVKAESNGYGSIVALAQLKRTDEPRPLKVGDKVRSRRGGNTGIIDSLTPGDPSRICVIWKGSDGVFSERIYYLEFVE